MKWLAESYIIYDASATHGVGVYRAVMPVLSISNMRDLSEWQARIRSTSIYPEHRRVFGVQAYIRSTGVFRSTGVCPEHGRILGVRAYIRSTGVYIQHGCLFVAIYVFYELYSHNNYTDRDGFIGNNAFCWCVSDILYTCVYCISFINHAP